VYSQSIRNHRFSQQSDFIIDTKSTEQTCNLHIIHSLQICQYSAKSLFVTKHTTHSALSARVPECQKLKM